MRMRIFLFFFILSSFFIRKEILQDFVTLMAIQEGRQKMKDIVSYFMVNTTMESNVRTFIASVYSKIVKFFST